MRPGKEALKRAALAALPLASGPPPGAAVRLRTLGRLELVAETAGGPGVRLLGPSKPLALLAYLALAPHRRAPRDRLVSLLWSDADADRGRSTLRQTLWALRQRLGEAALVTEGEEVVLGLPLAVDAEAFTAAVEGEALAEAWALYTGPFIPDFALLGGARFEHWADARREELGASWRSVGERLARQALDAARPQEAIPVLQALVAADPTRPEPALLLLEALMAGGDRGQAVREVDRLERALADADVRPGAALRAMLQRVRRAAATPTASDGPRRPELVGREAALAALLAGWRRAAAGVGTVQLMRAPAGLGKTRMLAEVRQRLDDLGVGVVPLRAQRADRDIPYALAASMATALASRAGAAGVSMATASILVELAPTLSNAYPSAAPQPTPPADALRVRTLALEELLRAVTDEAPLALLVDDLHWGDDASRQLVASLCERAMELPLLLVLAMRPMRGDWPVPPAALSIDLLPLALDQLELLLASMARGTPELLGEVARVLHAASGGIPLLVMAALDLAQDRGWLRIEGEEWRATAPESLGELLAGASVLDQLLRDLPADALAMLVALALVHGALPATVLRRVAGSAEAGGVLEVLEQRGLVMPSGQGWEVAHDRLGDAALGVASVEHRRAVTDRLAEALLEDPGVGGRTWQVAGRLLMPVHPDYAGRCFRRWMELEQPTAVWRDPLSAAATFLGPEARVPDVQQLARQIPLRARLRRGYPTLSAALGVALLAVAVSTLTVLGQRWFVPRAVRMELVEPNSSRGFLFDPDMDLPGYRGPVRAPVPLRVSFRDPVGRPTTRAPRAVAVRLVEGTGSVRLSGRATAPVRNGEAVFGDLRITGAGGFRLEVRAPGMPIARTRRLYAALVGTVPDARVTMVDGVVNGQPVDSVHREVRVRPGEPLVGAVTFRVLTDSRTAAILFGGVALWGDRRTQSHAIKALPPHGESTFQEPLEDKVTGHRWVAPARVGRYPILFVFEGETEMRFIASSTNWKLGAPRWDDGNDLADLTPSHLRRLEQEGRIFRPKTLLPGDSPRPETHQPTTMVESPYRLVGTVLWVRVVAP